MKRVFFFLILLFWNPLYSQIKKLEPEFTAIMEQKKSIPSKKIMLKLEQEISAEIFLYCSEMESKDFSYQKYLGSDNNFLGIIDRNEKKYFVSVPDTLLEGAKLWIIACGYAKFEIPLDSINSKDVVNVRLEPMSTEYLICLTKYNGGIDYFQSQVTKEHHAFYGECNPIYFEGGGHADPICAFRELGYMTKYDGEREFDKKEWTEIYEAIDPTDSLVYILGENDVQFIHWPQVALPHLRAKLEENKRAINCYNESKIKFTVKKECTDSISDPLSYYIMSAKIAELNEDYMSTLKYYYKILLIEPQNSEILHDMRFTFRKVDKEDRDSLYYHCLQTCYGLLGTKNVFLKEKAEILSTMDILYYPEACEIYRTILKESPKDKLVLLNLSKLLITQGRKYYAEAEIYCKLLLENSYYSRDLVENFRKMGRKHFSDALFCCNKMIEENPGNFRILFIKAELFRKMGNNYFQEALNLYDSIVANYKISDKDLSAIYNNRGLLLDHKERRFYPEALFSYTKSIKYNPTSHLPWCNKGALLQRMGKKYYPEALNCYNIALQYDSTNQWVLRQKAVLYLDEKKHVKALNIIDSLINKEPNSSINYMLKSVFLAQKGRKYYPEALTLYEKSLQLNSVNKSTYINGSMMFAIMKNYPKALNNIDSALSIDPDDPELYYRKSYVLSKMGRKYILEAQKYYDIAYEMDPGTEDWTKYIDKLKKRIKR